MRLLHVSHQYRPAIGGSEQHFADLSEALVRRGHDVDVVTTRASSIQTWRSKLPGRELLNGVQVYRYRGLQRGRLGWYALKYGYAGHEKLGGALFDALVLLGNGPLAPGIARHLLLRGNRYDAIHLQTLPFAHIVYGYYCARRARRPIIITPHVHVDHTDVFDLGVYNRVLRDADLVMADSEREVPYFIERGVDPERILVAGIGIEAGDYPSLDQTTCRSRIGIPRDAFVVLFLGRKVEYKGLETLLRAHAQIVAQHPNLYLVTAGPGTDYFRTIAAQYRSLPRWMDLDQVTDNQKVELLNSSDALVLPSTGEAFGIVFLEAWAVKRPVIGARAGAIPWVIDEGENGLLVDPKNPSDLAQAIETLLRYPVLGRAYGAAGYQKLHQRYTVDCIAARVENAYRELIAHRSPANISFPPPV